MSDLAASQAAARGPAFRLPRTDSEAAPDHTPAAPPERIARPEPGRRIAPPSLPPPWAGWLLGRLAAGVLTVLAISFLVFLATQALPSDPARVILGAEAPQSSVDTLKAQLGLDRPVWEQYGHWLGHVATGDFGRSIDSDTPVAAMIAGRAANSLTLVLLVLGLGVPAAVAIGLAMALREGSRFDHALLSALIIAKAVPNFILGVGLMVVFAIGLLRILPAVSLLDAGEPALFQPAMLVLPVLTLLCSVLPYLTRMIRGSAIEILRADYVVAARIRGIPESAVLLRHVLPNALIPLVQAVAISARVMLGGALLVEVVFSYPGLGTSLNTAVELRDIPVIQVITLLVSAAIVLINFAADLATLLLTPGGLTRGRPSLATGARARLRFKGGA